MLRQVFIFFTATLALFGNAAFAQQENTEPVDGLRSQPPSWIAIRNATVHATGTKQLDNATVLIKDEKIVGVGPNVQIPDGAEVIDAAGKHIYPGWIDAYVAQDGSSVEESELEYWNRNIASTRQVSDSIEWDALKLDDRRKAGITAALVAPGAGIVRGTSCVVHLQNESPKQSIVRADVAMHLQLTRDFSFADFDSGGRSQPSYPTSPMGAYALVRQTLYDALWYHEAWQAASNDPSLARPETNESLAALQDVIGGQLPVAITASNEIFALRAKRFADEFGLQLLLIGSGNEYRRIDEVARLGVPVIVPLDFPSPPEVEKPVVALNTSLESLMHWDLAPDNPRQLAAAGVAIGLTTDGLKEPSELLSQLRIAVRRGLPESAAIDALTSSPARILGVDQQLGSIEPGKFASLVICDKPLFDDESKIVETWVAGRRFEFDRTPAIQIDGLWNVTAADSSVAFAIAVWRQPKPSAAAASSADAVVGDDATEIKNVELRDFHFNGTLDTQWLEKPGISTISWVVDQAGIGLGELRFPDGASLAIAATRTGDAPEKKSKSKEENENDADTASAEPDSSGGPAAQDQEPEASESDDQRGKKAGDYDEVISAPALFAANYPLGDFGRYQLPAAPESALIKNVTIWSCGPDGVIADGAVLFGRGKIIRVFKAGESLPAADVVIDGSGMHLTPGIIDCHSHMATDSGVNEVGQAVTAEVRIGDYIDCMDINIYRQLAGGVTAANILHGSANPIGGQNQVIKLRWGLNDEQLKFAEAPPGIKFALGENVKQSNRRSASDRYPQSRMGVEQLMHDSFRAAIEYRQRWQDWQSNRSGLPPRRDLELDALAEVTEGDRWIHCHSYRQDEILALIRVLDEYKIQIGSFQHILEGYKVADAMARHGATASAFADWWAYKFEVYDAIPYAGAIMHNQGIVVSFNSDDAELGRHLNHEAAKAVRFGGVPEAEALKFVTLNPAIQLRIDDYVGSIEPGKHADFALWNGHPLALTSRCEQTWVDGRKYFDRTEDAALQAEQAEMKAQLVQKVLKSGGKPGGGDNDRFDFSRLWPRYDEYCHGHAHDEHDHEGH